jgi:hypothetical protein
MAQTFIDNSYEILERMIYEIIDKYELEDIKDDWINVLVDFYHESNGTESGIDPYPTYEELLRWMRTTSEDDKLVEFFKERNQEVREDKIYWEFEDIRMKAYYKSEKEALKAITAAVVKLWNSRHNINITKDGAKAEIGQYAVDRLNAGDMRWVSWYEVLNNMNTVFDIEDILGFIDKRHQEWK